MTEFRKKMNLVHHTSKVFIKQASGIVQQVMEI